MYSLSFNAFYESSIRDIFKVKLIDEKKKIVCVFVRTSKSVRFCYPLVSYHLFKRMLVPHFCFLLKKLE